MLGRTLSHYEIVEELGAGGMGVVYKARDVLLHRLVALKLLPEERSEDNLWRRRFLREARAASALAHPHIVTIHDIVAADGVDFIVMEYVDGERLDRLIPPQGLGLEQALRYALQMGSALAAAHAAGVVHRDLKPNNVMVTREDDRVKVLDFGVAKISQAAAADTAGPTVTAPGLVTGPGAAPGTLAYMSPEQSLGETVDRRSDVFSFGVVLHEMLTGQRPFHGAHAAELLHQLHYAAPPPLRLLRHDLPAALEPLVQRALAKRPEARYPRMDDVVQELEQVVASTIPGSGTRVGPGGARPGRAGPGRAGPGDSGSRQADATTPETPSAATPVSSGGRWGADPHRFVAYEGELASLDAWVSEACFFGRGRVAFVTGEAGSGKTAMVTELARRARRAHPELVAASAGCNAHTGTGDPYLPFRELLGLLTGDVETRRAAGTMDADEASRLSRLLPLSVRALVDSSPDLIDAFVPGEALLARARAVAPRAVAPRAGAPRAGAPRAAAPEASDWLESLERLVERRAAVSAAQLKLGEVLAQYTRVLEALARRHPLLVVLDDLHWADTGTIGLLFHLGRKIRNARILIVGTYRPADVAVGRGGERHPLEEVLSELRREFGDRAVELDKADGRVFVDALLDAERNRLGTDFRDALYRQTGGYPLYTIELLRGMQERGALVRDAEGRWIAGPELDWDTLPARVEAVIGERIGRLSEKARRILTLASVEGREFTAEVVARSLGASHLKVVRRLSGELDRRHRLVGAQDVRTVGGRRLSSYRFRHILFQRYLYDRLDRAERAYLHERVGKELERLYGDEAEDIAIQLARHARQAGLASKAAEYLLQAGGRAARLSATAAAIEHFRDGLALLEPLPPTPLRGAQQLELLTALGAVLIAAQGYASAEVEKTYSRAREIHLGSGVTPELFWVVLGLWSFYFVRAELDEAYRLGRQLLEIAELANDPELRVEALSAVGQTETARGEVAAARQHLERALELIPGDRDPSGRWATAQDARVAILSFLALSLWQLGRPDEALRRNHQAVARARQLEQPFSLAFALNFSAYVRQQRREPSAGGRDAAELIELCRRHGFFWGTIGEVLAGWAEGRVGGGAGEALARMRRGLAAYLDTGARLSQPFLHLQIVDVCMRHDRLEEARRELEESRAAIEETGERYWEAEHWRLAGELELAAAAAEGDAANRRRRAETALEKALAVARGQGARSTELRAAVSLGRLWHSEGRRSEARRLLEQTCGAFGEGADVADSAAAAALLEAL